jgi:pimeloyl-ACP methyl ester carboxylesterase
MTDSSALTAGAITESTVATSFGPVRVLTAGPADAPPMVLVHGYAASADQWRALMTHVSDRHRVMAFDLLGFGAAPAPAPPYTVERWVEEVEIFVEAAGKGVMLVGHSLGGLIAAEVARRQPDRPRALALLCPFGVTPPLFALGTRGPLRHLVDPLRRSTAGELLVRWVRQLPRALAWPLAVSAFHRPFDAPADAVDQWRWLINQPHAERALLDVVRRLEHLETGLTAGEITMPALVIWGRQDRLLPVSLAAAWHERLPQAELVILNGCAHLPHIERRREVAAALERLADRAGAMGDA